MAAEVVFLGYLRRVYRVELRVLPRELAADVRGDFRFKLVRLPRAVEQQRAALLELADYVVMLDVGRVVRRHEIRELDEVRRAYRRVGEAQVRYRDAEGFLRVVLEVGLPVFARVAVDDVYCVFVRADCAVAAEPPELEGELARAVGVDARAERQR